MKYLFWNIHNNNSILSLIVELVIEYNVDFIALAECANEIEICNQLNVFANNSYNIVDTIGCKRVKLISNNSNIEQAYSSKYCSIQFINNNLFAAFVHLPSKLHNGLQRNIAEARDIALQLSVLEDKYCIDNIIVVGDINTNPYEYSSLAADAFHGIPFYNDSLRIKRQIDYHTYKLYYNPMWRFYNNRVEPFGTYYLANNDYCCSYWNIYDQIIMRPKLKQLFVEDSLEIITHIGSKSLLDNNGHPNVSISDHLPIVFELEV